MVLIQIHFTSMIWLWTHFAAGARGVIIFQFGSAFTRSTLKMKTWPHMSLLKLKRGWVAGGRAEGGWLAGGGWVEESVPCKPGCF